MFGIGGSEVDYSISTNPAFAAGALGRLAVSVNIIEIVGAVSCALTDRLSVGIAPTITRTELVADRMWLLPAGSSSYAYDPTTRHLLGGGVQGGIFYTTDAGWQFGASLKSPQWMEPLHYRTTGAQNQVSDAVFRFSYPLTAAVGVAYAGFDRWLLACDLRYFNYAGATGFGTPAFTPSGTLNGLGWYDVCSLAAAVQRQVTDRLSWRLGYCYNDCPIGNGRVATLSAAMPLVTQHSLHTGASYVFGQQWIVSVAYAHCFENTVAGPILDSTSSPIAGTRVASRVSGDVFSMGVTKRF
jgi:long-subunit fatty acid transport protein